MIALSSHKIFCPGIIAYHLVEPMKKVIFYPRKFPVLLGFELASQSLKHQTYAVTVYQLKHTVRPRDTQPQAARTLTMHVFE